MSELHLIARAHLHPAAIALRSGSQERSYAELLSRSASWAAVSCRRRIRKTFNWLCEHEVAFCSVVFNQLLFDEPGRAVAFTSEATAAIESIPDEDCFTTVVEIFDALSSKRLANVLPDGRKKLGVLHSGVISSRWEK